MYANGSALELIITKNNITHKQVIDILIGYKNESRYKRTFTDEFRTMIAERDINGVARRQIAIELDINVSTVQSACKAFGQAIKERASSDNAYTYLPDVKDLKVCPTCKSKKINEIDSMLHRLTTKGIFCMDCGDEHFTIYNSKVVDDNGKEVELDIKKGVYKVNFEYLD